MRLKVATDSKLGGLSLERGHMEMSPWTTSRAKRVFDVALVLLSSPIVLPLLLLIALAVGASSAGPILFRQKRVGRFGEPFEIYKFRTMLHAPTSQYGSIASMSADRITRLGRILRWLKFDELPQVLNVLAGQMSLVGPRPLVPEQQLRPLQCLPGVTGLATLAFAREESSFVMIPKDTLPEYYRKTILPAKQLLDAGYMKRATLFSDLKLIFDTAFRCWGAYALSVVSSPAEIFMTERLPGVQSASQQ
jgi:lipopolysaccharide/colanic/teichoic acid biosynthesis glycosyltransferase